MSYRSSGGGKENTGGSGSGGDKPSAFDDQGFLLFTTAALALILLPWAAALFFAVKKRFAERNRKPKALDCDCKQCYKVSREKSKRSDKGSLLLRTPTVVLFLVLLTALAVLLRLVIIAPPTKGPEEATRFDPYEILQIKEGASTEEIKSSFRLLSRKWHPDKNPTDEAREKFILISKAYETLTDEATRENYEKYGNPDGPGETVVEVALPTFLLEKKNRSYVLAGYLLVLVIVPTSAFIVLKKWNSVAPNKVKYNTMQQYTYFIPDKAKSRTLLEIIYAAEEVLECVKIRKEDEESLTIIEKHTPIEERIQKKKIPPFLFKANILLAGHVSRVHEHLPLQSEKDLTELLELTPNLASGMISVLAAKRNLMPTIEAIKVLQMIVQACPEEQPLLQLPGINRDVLEDLNVKRLGKINKLQQLIQMTDEKIEYTLSQCGFSETEIDVLENVLNFLPKIQVSCNFSVEDDEENVITAGAIVNCNVSIIRPSPKPRKSVAERKILTESPSNSSTPPTLTNRKTNNNNNNKKSDDDSENEIQSSIKESPSKKKSQEPVIPVIAHAPFFPIEKTENWYVILGDTGRNEILGVTKVATTFDTPCEALLKIQAPPAGKYELSLFVMSDSYLGLDERIPIHLVVAKEKAPVISSSPQQVEANSDDDSDDEEEVLSDLSSDEESKEYEYSDEEPDDDVDYL